METDELLPGDLVRYCYEGSFDYCLLVLEIFESQYGSGNQFSRRALVQYMDEKKDTTPCRFGFNTSDVGVVLHIMCRVNQ